MISKPFRRLRKKQVTPGIQGHAVDYDDYRHRE
jgi:hypothetical protein